MKSILKLLSLLALMSFFDPFATCMLGKAIVTKPGECPDLTGRVGICLHGCDDDGSCDGIKKCCSNGCGKVCMKPVLGLVSEPAILANLKPVLEYVANDQTWEQYKTKFNKVYTTEEEKDRRNKWESSIKMVNKHNLEYSQGIHTHLLAVNQFADGTNVYNGLRTKKPERIVEVHVANNETWAKYKERFNKKYTSTEEPIRRKIWEHNIKKANLHNEGYKSGHQSWSMGINQFSDGTKFTPGIMRPIVPEKNVPFYVATNETWALYKKRFNKNYASNEESIKRKIWEHNIEKANLHNEGYKAGHHKWTKGINQFSDGTRPGMGLLRPSIVQIKPIVPTKVAEYYVANNDTWEAYKNKFNKIYTVEEELEKRPKWENSVNQVNKHNSEYNEGKHSWTMGINQFSDGTKPGMGLMRPNIAPEYEKSSNIIPRVPFGIFTSSTGKSQKNQDLQTSDQDWLNYKIKYNKIYSTEKEEALRRGMWEKSVLQVNKHNTEMAAGMHTYTQGINKFSDGTKPGMGLMRPNIAPEFEKVSNSNENTAAITSDSTSSLILKPATFVGPDVENFLSTIYGDDNDEDDEDDEDEDDDDDEDDN